MKFLHCAIVISAMLLQACAAKTEDAVLAVPGAPQAPQAPSATDATMPTQVAESVEPAFSPSFDCGKVTNDQERLICSDQTLSGLDVELFQFYRSALECSLDKAQLKREQNVWLTSGRNACHDIACMTTSYEERIRELRVHCG